MGVKWDAGGVVHVPELMLSVGLGGLRLSNGLLVHDSLWL